MGFSWQGDYVCFLNPFIAALTNPTSTSPMLRNANAHFREPKSIVIHARIAGWDGYMETIETVPTLPFA
jgi:hypothetical protein